MDINIMYTSDGQWSVLIDGISTGYTFETPHEAEDFAYEIEESMENVTYTGER